MRIYICNIPKAVTRDDLRAMFERFGAVEIVGIVRDRRTGMNSGDGFVEMCNPQDAEVAISRLHHTQYGGRTISVSRAPADQIDA